MVAFSKDLLINISLSSATEYSLDEIILKKTPRFALDVTTDDKEHGGKAISINKALCENMCDRPGLTNWTIVKIYITF